MLFLGRGLDTHLKLGGYCIWEHYRYCPIGYDIIRCGYLYSGWLEYPCDIIYKQKMEEIRKMKNKDKINEMFNKAIREKTVLSVQLNDPSP